MKSDKVSYIIAGFIVISLIILLSFILTTSFSSINSVETSKKIYYVDNISNAQQKVINKFNELNKGKIEVVGINLPFEIFSTNERKELLARYLRSKSELIDIIAVDQIWTARFSKWAYPMTHVFNKLPKNSLLDVAVNSCYYDSMLVALPLYLDISVMFYRDDLLKKFPNYHQIIKLLNNGITWEDFITTFEQYSNNYPIFTFQGADYEGLICFYSELLAMENSSIIDNDTINFDKAVHEKMLSFIYNLIHKYKISDKIVTKLKENSSYDYFIKNNGLFLRAWPGFESEINKYLVKDSNIVINKCQNPYFRGSNPKSVFGGWNVIINKNSTKINEAEKFIEFLLSEEAQKILFEEGNVIPVNKKIYNDTEYLKLHPNLSYYNELIKTGFFRPHYSNYTHVSDLLSYYLNSALENRISVKQAFEKAKSKILTQSILIK
ncbi:MAG TPA: extracellular solute-binding protein [Melioribacteraceae bacterium]|nr:extracellular solute-binding protein [Melioribacteraceae bacterium]